MKSYITLKTRALGELMLIASDTKLTDVYFIDCKHAPAPGPDWKRNPKHPILKKAAAEIRGYLSGRITRFSVPLEFKGTEFQHKVWQQIALIPFGQTISYTELSRRVGAPAALRAAGSATGKNPLGIIIPCHRVLAKDGTIGGYAGGLERKRRLLDLESKARPNP